MTDEKGLTFLKYCINMLLWKNKQVLQWRNGQRTWTEYSERINILKYIFSDGKSEENCNSFQSW